MTTTHRSLPWMVWLVLAICVIAVCAFVAGCQSYQRTTIKPDGTIVTEKRYNPSKETPATAVTVPGGGKSDGHHGRNEPTNSIAGGTGQRKGVKPDVGGNSGHCDIGRGALPAPVLPAGGSAVGTRPGGAGGGWTGNGVIPAPSGPVVGVVGVDRGDSGGGADRGAAGLDGKSETSGIEAANRSKVMDFALTVIAVIVGLFLWDVFGDVIYNLFGAPLTAFGAMVLRVASAGQKKSIAEDVKTFTENKG